MEKPVGFSTFVGITSGYWVQNASNYNYSSSVGVAATQYVVVLEDSGQISGINTGDV